MKWAWPSLKVYQTCREVGGALAEHGQGTIVARAAGGGDGLVRQAPLRMAWAHDGPSASVKCTAQHMQARPVPEPQLLIACEPLNGCW